ncbi:early nodulin-like protein 6 [Actinidia eriantha]|uniref:early nodulin-like protein 6 n=1 Tax=Actinidia eriantha TaxID=165200 RepID=UPI0025861147|nr:early nodulin-like protein 6 [Actinidia eriantha]
MGIWKVVVFSVLFSSLHLFTAMCFEFKVGEDNGWGVPSSKNDQIYNQWASKNRFKVNDTLKFEYKKDSVLVVTEEEYNKCKSFHPMSFFNNGDTVYKLDRPGLFYFISGVAGHCERGLKMIIKVLEPESPPPPPPSNNGAAEMASPSVVLPMMTMPFFGVLFM